MFVHVHGTSHVTHAWDLSRMHGCICHTNSHVYETIGGKCHYMDKAGMSVCVYA